MSHEPTRAEAWEMLQEWVKSENLRRHMLAVEACMRAYARKMGEGEERWGIVGLVHDLDYERYPTREDHPFRGVAFLRERGWPEDMLAAILGHADYAGVARETPMAKALFAVDELSGFITACALVRPDKSLENLEVKSVKKKLKDKAFAKGVSREDIYRGAEEFGVPLEEHIAFCIAAMQPVEKELGLGVGG
ncbi:MAG: HAD family hydrolase [Bacillota bacterium]|nr:HAD family hydrolase [Bacillota bacterium]